MAAGKYSRLHAGSPEDRCGPDLRARPWQYCRSQNARGGCDTIIFLHSLGHLDAETRHEIRIFAIGIFHPTPTLVARDIQRWRVNVCVAQSARFCGGNRAYFTNEFFVPGVTLSDFGWKAGSRI